MIKRKTLFVLGAGASMPYKFPSGEGLYREICRGMEGNNFQYPIDFARLASECNILKSSVDDFRLTLTRSGANSIDTFLAYRPQFERIGKLAIAYAIGHRENAGCLDPDVDDHWYRYLWAHMHAGATDARSLTNNKVRFITFNYDRTLEYFLFQAIANLYGVDDQAAMQVLKSLEIEHVYGRAGGLNFGNSGEPGRDFVRVERSADLLEAASTLRTIPELRADDEAFQRFRKSFDWAEDVVVTGFSFDPLNCERLGFNSVIEWNEAPERRKPPPLIYVSTLGMTKAQVNTARRRLFRGQELNAVEGTTLELLRHYAMFD